MCFACFLSNRLQDALWESDSRVKSLSARVLHTERAIHILIKRLDEIEAQIADILEAKENSKAGEILVLIFRLVSLNVNLFI